jgi:hypothetical protein
MIFQKESIEAILAGRKTMTRRLVKEGEFLHEIYLCGKDITSVIKDLKNRNKKGNIVSRYKWQVGRKYAVCVEGKQVWYCPKCKKIVNQNENNWNYSKRIDLFKPIQMPFNYCGGEVSFKFPSGKCKYNPCGGKLERLFVEVTGIRKEKLLDITEEDAKREGFRHTCEIICDDDKINLYTRQNFIDAFCKIYGIGFREDGVPNQNPYTWVISFKVV